MKVLMISALDFPKVNKEGKILYHSSPWITNLSQGLMQLGNNVKIIGFNRHIQNNEVIKENIDKEIYKIGGRVKQLVTNFKDSRIILKDLYI